MRRQDRYKPKGNMKLLKARLSMVKGEEVGCQLRGCRPLTEDRRRLRLSRARSTLYLAVSLYLCIRGSNSVRVTSVESRSTP